MVGLAIISSILVILPPLLNGLPATSRTLGGHSSLQSIECITGSDCYPQNVNITELIQCVQSVCLCYPCFLFNTTTGGCGISDCFSYVNNSCIDNRPAQGDAFLLSLFLSSFGTANFYIGNYMLAIIQLSLTFLLVLLCFSCCFYVCCLFKCEDGCCEMCDMEDSCFPSLTLICCMGIGFALLLTIACWWMIDLIVFGLNQRNDGSGCTLRDNL